MKNRIKILKPEINDAAIDSRGAIYSFVPHNAIVEFCYLVTKAGITRGHHYHKEFDEYIMLVHGEGIYVEYLDDSTTEKIILGPGQTIYIPRLTAHTFVPISDCKSISMLTKQWNHCVEPITPMAKV